MNFKELFDKEFLYESKKEDKKSTKIFYKFDINIKKIDEAEATPEQPSQDVEVQAASQETSETPDADVEVHIIGYGEVQGHVAVRLDTDGDGQADVAIIDVDDSGGLSDPDVLVDDQGNMATYGELNNEPDPNLLASMENPNVAPDMPDYMNEANVDDMNVIA